jgi:hypothetical protein
MCIVTLYRMLIYFTLCELCIANECNVFINSHNDIMKKYRKPNDLQKKIPPMFYYEKVGLLQLASANGILDG